MLLVAAGAGVLRRWGGPGPAPATVTVLIPEGASLAAAAAELEKARAIYSAREFLLLARFLGSGTPIQAGEYSFPAHLSQSDVLKKLQGGETVQHFVMVTPGMPSVVVWETLMKEPGLVGEVAVPPEGSVLPDSYSYTRGEARQAVLERMQKAMVNYLAKAWQRRKPGIAVDNPRDALILASIVEKEAGKPNEWRLVSAVYSNRLKRGMKLEADPTVIYPVTKGKPLGRRILQSELHADSGYNTYVRVGLPIGPITNPSRTAIDAVLDPASSNAIFFVADGTGGHVFADTYEQHQINVQKWYAIRRSRGEM